MMYIFYIYAVFCPGSGEYSQLMSHFMGQYGAGGGPTALPDHLKGLVPSMSQYWPPVSAQNPFSEGTVAVSVSSCLWVLVSVSWCRWCRCSVLRSFLVVRLYLYMYTAYFKCAKLISSSSKIVNVHQKIYLYLYVVKIHVNVIFFVHLQS